MKKQAQRILDTIKRIAYRPTRGERAVFADVILQQITAMKEWDKNPMAVAIRTDAPGVLLAYNGKDVKAFTEGQLATVLAHETQHIRKGDNAKMKSFVGQEFANGWKGPMLFNVARDCQINDELYRLGFDKVEGVDGESMLGRNTEADAIDALMAEIAEKIPPPPEDEAGGGQGDVEAADELQEAGEGKPVQAVDVGKMADKSPTLGTAKVKSGVEQARWDNFLATILCTRQSEDRWHQQPKRMSGVDLYSSYDATLPRRQPMPRKSALMAIDVSGSMDEKGVQRLCALVRGAPANYDLTVVCFDTGIDEWKDFRNNDTMPRRGGGTDFNLVEKYATGMPRYPDAILVLTDGEAAIPTVKAPKNYTWVLYGADVAEFQAQAHMRSVDLNAIIKR